MGENSAGATLELGYFDGEEGPWDSLRLEIHKGPLWMSMKLK